MNWYLEQPYFLRTADVDAGGEWRSSAMFIAMQEAGGAHSHALGIGMDVLRQQNLAWVLSRAQLHMDRIPVLGETVILRTWPTPTRHFFCPRDYAFFVDGKQVGYASTLYVVLDLTERKIVQPYLPEGTKLDCPSDMVYPIPGNIASLECEPRCIPYQARYSDLDVNGHVNNAKYLDWFCDQFDQPFHQRHHLTDVLIHYNHEIHPDETVTLKLQQRDSLSVMQGTSSELIHFALRGQWAER